MLTSDHRIDANVEASELNVELAHGEILQYFQSISSNRSVLINIFIKVLKHKDWKKISTFRQLKVNIN